MRLYAGIDLHSSNNYIGIINVKQGVRSSLLTECWVNRKCFFIFQDGVLSYEKWYSDP